MAEDLKGMRVAILATDGVERVELEQPRGALYGVGAASDLLSMHTGEIQARQFDLVPAGTLAVDRQVTDASAGEYDALLLPGGMVNPDKLRMHSDAIGFVRDFAATGKPVAAICHGPWTLIEADVVRGHRLTSWPSLWTDLRKPARRPSTRKSSSTASSRPAVRRQTCPLSARRSSPASPAPARPAKTATKDQPRWIIHQGVVMTTPPSAGSPPPRQHQPYPGTTGEMTPKPADEMRNYAGRGLLDARRALITGGDSGIGRGGRGRLRQRGRRRGFHLPVRARGCGRPPYRRARGRRPAVAA